MEGFHYFNVAQAQWEEGEHDGQLDQADEEVHEHVVVSDVTKLVVHNSTNLICVLLFNQSVKNNHFPKPPEPSHKSITVRRPLAAVDYFNLTDWNRSFLGLFENPSFKFAILHICQSIEHRNDQNWDQKLEKQDDSEWDRGKAKHKIFTSDVDNP